MRTSFLLICCMLSSAVVHAAQTCKPDFIPASTPDSQLTDNSDGTVTDKKTGLMWKKCLEGSSGDNCENGVPNSFTWQQALQQPSVVNNAGGLAGYADWRLPNIRELISIVEEQCYSPAVNLNYFPNTIDSGNSGAVWSGSPSYANTAWFVYFLGYGHSYVTSRNDSWAVRLVRGGN